jgi:hypothetical protein
MYEICGSYVHLHLSLLTLYTHLLLRFKADLICLARLEAKA